MDEAKNQEFKFRTGISPKGNNWQQVEEAAIKIGGEIYAHSTDTLLCADVVIARAKKAGKSDAEISQMNKEQLMDYLDFPD